MKRRVAGIESDLAGLRTEFAVLCEVCRSLNTEVEKLQPAKDSTPVLQFYGQTATGDAHGPA